MQSWILNSAFYLFLFSFLSTSSALSQEMFQVGERTFILQVPELQNMDDFTILSAELFNKYDTRTFGEGIAQRLHLREEKMRPESAIPYDFMGEDTQITLYFSGDSIVGDSVQFQNQHQTGGSKVAKYNPYDRSEMENRLSRLRLEEYYNGFFKNIVHLLRPKYAALNFSKDIVLPGAASTGAQMYGIFVAVLKNNVKLRATWLPEDAPNLSSLELLKERQFTFYRNTYPNFKRLSDYGPNDVQIWGQLDIRDVEYFIVPDPIPYFGDKGIEIQEQIQKLIRTGVPVYAGSTVRDRKLGRVVIQREKQISAGDITKIMAYEASLNNERRGWFGTIKCDAVFTSGF